VIAGFHLKSPKAFSVNAPVMDASRQVVAGLSVSGPVFRLNDEKLKIYIQLVSAAAKEISEKLGYIRDR
jgi:DNA-binding IclR family transcriptional regulator